MLIAFAALTVLVAVCVRHYKASELQRERVEELKRLAGSHNAIIWFLYDDYARWNEKLGQHQLVPPPSGLGGSNALTGWIKSRFGVNFLYKPVVMVYDCRDTVSELKLTDQLAAKVRLLPIREIRICKSQFFGAEMYNALTRDEYLRIAEQFPDRVVVRVPDELE